MFLFCFITEQIIGQDLHYSNIHSMNQQVFPEFAGLNNDLEATVYYREQWKTIGSKYGAMGASFASTLQPKHKSNGSHLSGGVNFYRERMNKDASLTSARMTIVQHQQIASLSKISFGLNMGIQSLTFDPVLGSWGSQHNGLIYDPNMSSGETFSSTSKTALDVGAGAIYSLKHKKSSLHLFQFGISVQHLNRPNLSFYKDRNGYLPIKTVGFGSLNLKIGKKGSSFQSTILVQKQSTFSSVVFGGFFRLNLREKAKTTSTFAQTDKVLLGIGGYYRSSDAFIACLMLQKTAWNISMAYDFTTSNLNQYNYSRGAIELQLQFTIPSFQMESRY